MAQDIAHQATGQAPALPALKKWISPTASLVLGSNPAEFDASFARRKLQDAREDIPALLRSANDSIRPVQVDWLAARLKVVWQSTAPAGSMDPKAWLHETGRLLKSFPQDILAHAIDEAVRRSSFTPTAASILAIAKPLLDERQRQQQRLYLLVNGPAKKTRYPWETAHTTFDPSTRPTPEEAAEIRRAAGLDDPENKGFKARDYGKLRMPTAEELADLAAEMRAVR